MGIESRVAEAILEKAEEITIMGESMIVSPPSIATLILVSEAVAKLPSIKMSNENIFGEAISVAKDCRILGDIVAILILGAKNIKSTKRVEKKRLFGLLKEHDDVAVDNLAELSKRILEDVSPRDLQDIVIRLLKTMQITDFFSLTTSLIEINLLRATREVGTEAIASGR